MNITKAPWVHPFATHTLDHMYQDTHEHDVHLHLHHGDLTDATNLIRIIKHVQPDEIYNLAAQSLEFTRKELIPALTVC